MHKQSRCQREPVRYQWGAYDGMYGRVGAFAPIWVVPQKLITSFCPLE